MTPSGEDALTINDTVHFTVGSFSSILNSRQLSHISSPGDGDVPVTGTGRVLENGDVPGDILLVREGTSVTVLLVPGDILRVREGTYVTVPLVGLVHCLVVLDVVLAVVCVLELCGRVVCTVSSVVVRNLSSSVRFSNVS